MKNTKSLGFSVPEVMVPAEGVNLKKWSCVACDQFTSQPDYWNSVEKTVGSAPSTLHIMLPEIYLEGDNVDVDIQNINQTMYDYLEDGVLEVLPQGIILTERTIGNNVRKGILLAMDLEEYDYTEGSTPTIRATEQTVLSRIPPRVKIRMNAPIEMPHIMLMIDDPTDSVIGNLHAQRNSLQKIYDFDLMMDGGSLEGWLVSDENLLDETAEAISKLKRHDNMLYCVGDGNHSLATAKTIWEQIKIGLSEEEKENHEKRFALCEVINVQDSAVEFMPIHRVMFHVNPAQCVQFIVERLKAKGLDAKLLFGRFRKETTTQDGGFIIPFQYRDGSGKIIIEKPNHPLAVGEVQSIFEDYISKTKGSSIDYIHGDEAFTSLSKDYDNIGFYFDSLKKEEFFDMIIRCGVLPKKTFSLGEAEEKRYYMECRLLSAENIEENEIYEG